MSEIFNYPPHVELLQLLARGALKQNLPKALRLWTILRSLYGEETDPLRIDVPSRFTYSDWYKLFFTEPQHHKEDRVPSLHDRECPCAKTISHWLFHDYLPVNTQKWKSSFLKRYPMGEEEFHNLLHSRLLAKTRRNFEFDFQTLAAMGWLQTHKVPLDAHKNKMLTSYQKVTHFADLAFWQQFLNSNNGDVTNVLQSDLADFFDDFALEINGQQRFFLELDYIVSARFSERIDAFRQQLKQLWQKQPIPPIKITYVSARKFQNHQDEGEEYIVYPVCIYYHHRAPYLFAYGQTPTGDRAGKLDWYDYRLDRIKDLQELQWSQVELPNFSPDICKWKTPQQIEAMMGEAFGFDFYKPKELLLLRFERYFHYRYVEGTEREEIFKKIPFAEAVAEVKRADLDLAHKQQLLQLLKQRSPQDIYCRLYYRKKDHNAIMRLRAWGPKVEVFLPWDLRQQMTDDLHATWKLYNN